MLNQNVKTETLDPWQTILSEVKLEFIPTEYVAMAKVFFENGKIWEIDLSKKAFNSIEQIVSEIRLEYDDAIIRMDFKVNLEKVKNDISEETSRWMMQY